jgi:membrane protease YdiL (CAAX protease family)
VRAIDAYFALIQTGRNLWWHWILGLALIVAIFIAGNIVLFLGFEQLIQRFPDAYDLLLYAFMLLSFLPGFFGIMIVQKSWHRRSLRAMLTYTARFRWGNLFRAGLAFQIVTSLFFGINVVLYPEDLQDLTINPDMNLFAIATVLSLLLIPFQAATEEFLLRGYLNQALIKYLRSPGLVFFITSAGFAALHISNPEAEGQMIPYLLVIFMFGIAACILLYFEGGLESAIGLHIFNNIFVFSIIGYEDPDLPDTALFFTGPPEIDWSSVGWELLSLTLTVSLILWLNHRFERDVSETPRLQSPISRL